MNLTGFPPIGPGSIPSRGGIFQGTFSLTDHTLPTRPEPARQKVAQSPLNDATQPVEGCRKAGV